MNSFEVSSQLTCKNTLLCPIPFLNFLWKKNVQRKCLLWSLFLHRFYLENFFLDQYVRYNLTVYPVVIIALTGSACKNFSFSSPTTNGTFIGESFGLFTTLVKEGRQLLPHLSCVLGAERQTCLLKSIIHKKQKWGFTRRYSSFCNVKNRAEIIAHEPWGWIQTLCCLKFTSWCNVCPTILHYPCGSSGSSIWRRVGQRKSRAGMMAVNFH